LGFSNTFNYFVVGFDCVITIIGTFGVHMTQCWLTYDSDSDEESEQREELQNLLQNMVSTFTGIPIDSGNNAGDICVWDSHGPRRD